MKKFYPTTHFLERLKERFDLEGAEDINCIVARVRDKAYKLLKPIQNNKYKGVLILIRHKKKDIVIVINRRRRILITAMYYEEYSRYLK